MKRLFFVSATLYALLFANTAHAGWGAKVGDLLTYLPFVDVIGEKILENRVAYVSLNDQASQGIRGQVRRDLNSVANVRQSPGTGSKDKVVAQLRPGEPFVVLSELKNKPWLKIKLRSGTIAYIYKSLVSYPLPNSEFDDEISYQVDKRAGMDTSRRKEALDGKRKQEERHKNKVSPSESKALAFRKCKDELLSKGTDYYLNLATKMNMHSASTYSIHEEVAVDIKIDLLTGADGLRSDTKGFVAGKIDDVCKKYNS